MTPRAGCVAACRTPPCGVPFDANAEGPPALPQRLLLAVLFAPVLLGLAGLAGMVLAGLSPPDSQVMLSAVVVLQGGIAMIALVEVMRRFRDDDAAREADAAAARRAASEAAEEARANLLGAAAEEIQVPVAAIAGLLDTLAAEPELSQAGRRAAATARAAARDLVHVLGDLAGQPGPPAAGPPGFRVEAVMEEVVGLLAPAAAAREVTLATAIAAGTPPGWRGDPARLRQILLVLADAALRATTRGEVRLEARETATGALEIHVSATGQDAPGMTAQPSLSVGHVLARRMGGGILAQGAAGRGSVFTVILPLPRGEAPPPLPLARAPAAPPGLPVLVVDDVPANRRLLGAMLARAGFAHEEAADGEAALALLAARPYAAVLMDVEMPRLDGLEATRRLRAMGGPAARLPVAAVTANASPSAEAAARAAGVDVYLLKPVGAAELAGFLARARAVRQPVS